MTLTLGSLFDGIGGFPLAAIRQGITPLWASEIEPFPIQVTKHHFPETLHMGDITRLDGAKLPPVDIICGGSPCQELIRGILYPRRTGRRTVRAVPGADPGDKGDAGCGYTTRADRQVCSPQMVLLGECPRRVQQRLP